MLGLKIQDNADFGAEIIRTVREHRALSRVELARELGVAASTIGRHVDALVTGGYFRENVEPTKEAGRPPTRLRPNPERGSFVGVDFHSEMLFASAVDFGQQTIMQKSYPIQGSDGVEAVLAEISGALDDMKNAASYPVLAAGVATPGSVVAATGMAVSYSHVPGFEDIPLADMMSKVVQAPVFIEKNIRAMALAERWFGVARGCQEVTSLGVRIGISAGIVREGQLVTGFHGLGGELRNWNCPTYDAQKKTWKWDPKATVESTSCIPVMLKRYAGLSGKKVTQSTFLHAVLGGDSGALIALQESAAVHGWTIAQLVQISDPELVVLAGPLSTLGAVYLDAVTESYRTYASALHGEVPIKLSTLGEFAGAIGAAALAMERWRPGDLG